MYMEKTSNHRLQIPPNIMDTNNKKKMIHVVRIIYSVTSDNS